MVRKVIQLFFLFLFFFFLYFLKSVNPFFRIDPLTNLIGFIISGGLNFLFFFILFFLLIFIFGNIFCDYVCPLRTCFDLTHICVKYLKLKVLRNPLFVILREAKNLIFLLLLLLLFIFHKQLIFLFDPWVILTRTFTFKTLLPLAILLIIIIISGLSYRFWCNYLCPLGAVANILSKPRKLIKRTDFDRREVIKSLVLLPFVISGIAKKKTFLLRPPGSLKEDLFVLGCLRCGECIKVCPTKVIQPANFSDGIDNFWSPKLVYAKSYCAFDNCFLCYKVCPTNVIRKPDKKRIKIGVAKVNRETCLVWSKNTFCFICEEVCPKQAVYRTPGPTVDEEKCVGCGLCENRCPVSPPAIVVNVEGEVRA